MHQSHDDTIGAAMLKVTLYVVAWVGSWKVGEVQALFGALSALAIGVVAALNGYVLWRDKIRRRTRGRPIPPTDTMPLDER